MGNWCEGEEADGGGYNESVVGVGGCWGAVGEEAVFEKFPSRRTWDRARKVKKLASSSERLDHRARVFEFEGLQAPASQREPRGPRAGSQIRSAANCVCARIVHRRAGREVRV